MRRLRGKIQSETEVLFCLSWCLRTSASRMFEASVTCASEAVLIQQPFHRDPVVSCERPM